MKGLFPILFLVVAGGIFFGYINPAYGTIKKLRVEETAFNHALDRSKELQQARDELLARYNTFAPEDLDRLAKLIPDNVDNVRLILDLDSLASRHGMRLRNVSIQSTDEAVRRATAGLVGPSGSAHDELVLSFTVSGTYYTFRAFLADLERSLRLVDVVGIAFASTPSGLYDYSISIKTYWLKP